MMYPAPIDEYVVPSTISEALSVFDTYGDEAFYLAGGQSLMQAIKSRLVRPRCLVDLQKIDQLRGASFDDGCTIGSMTRYRSLSEDSRLVGAYAALRDAAAHVGDRQVRNRGTIGGSLCWNYVAACMPATNLGLGAKLLLMSCAGEARTVDIEDFLGAPMETDRKDGEMLLSVTIPAQAPRSGSAYKKWSLLSDGLPVVGVCVLVNLGADGRCENARVAIGGLHTGPVRSAVAEEALIGTTSADDGHHEAAFAAAAELVDPGDDLWASANYRRSLIRIIGREVTAAAFLRAMNKSENDG